jgi:hypothetical protein
VDATIQHEGKTYRLSEDGHKGKKAHQVASILKQLQENPGVPIRWEYLCEAAGAKYPQDVQACVMALEMVELVGLYKMDGKTFYIWTDEEPLDAEA